MSDVCDLTDLTTDGVTIRFRQQRHIDALQALARRVRNVFTEHGDYGVPGMEDRIARLESAVGALSVISETRWTARQVADVYGSVYSLLRVANAIPGFESFMIGDYNIDLDVLREAAEPLDEALRLIAAMRLRDERLAQAGGAS